MNSGRKNNKNKKILPTILISICFLSLLVIAFLIGLITNQNKKENLLINIPTPSSTIVPTSTPEMTITPIPTEGLSDELKERVKEIDKEVNEINTKIETIESSKKTLTERFQNTLNSNQIFNPSDLITTFNASMKELNNKTNQLENQKNQLLLEKSLILK